MGTIVIPPPVTHVAEPMYVNPRGRTHIAEYANPYGWTLIQELGEQRRSRGNDLARNLVIKSLTWLMWRLFATTATANLFSQVHCHKLEFMDEKAVLGFMSRDWLMPTMWSSNRTMRPRVFSSDSPYSFSHTISSQLITFQGDASLDFHVITMLSLFSILLPKLLFWRLTFNAFPHSYVCFSKTNLIVGVHAGSSTPSEKAMCD